jgi:hypothetical protein
MTETAIPRKATGWANYHGDVTSAIARDIEAGTPRGPNYMGELMWPVDAAYDAESNMTRVGFSLIAPEVSS